MTPYAALAEPHRRQILDLLREGERSVGELVAHVRLTQPGVSKHLRVLREAGLVEDRRPADDKRVRLYGLRSEPLEDLATWLGALSRDWQTQLDAFKDFVAVRTARPKETP